LPVRRDTETRRRPPPMPAKRPAYEPGYCEHGKRIRRRSRPGRCLRQRPPIIPDGAPT
jgi:hypothetical protein